MCCAHAADFTIVCGDDKYQQHLGYNIAMVSCALSMLGSASCLDDPCCNACLVEQILVYPIGVPVLFGGLLYAHRNRLHQLNVSIRNFVPKWPADLLVAA